jgi:hypothetical protein
MAVSDPCIGLVEIRGTMTECPERLKTGMSLMVTLHIYILPEAFKPLYISSEDVNKGFTYNEGYETQEERLVVECIGKLEICPDLGLVLCVRGKQLS